MRRIPRNVELLRRYPIRLRGVPRRRDELGTRLLTGTARRYCPHRAVLQRDAAFLLSRELPPCGARMSLITVSAGFLDGPDGCFIFAPGATMRQPFYVLEDLQSVVACGRSRLRSPSAYDQQPGPGLYRSTKAVERARDGLKPGSVFYYADEFKISWYPTLRPMWEPTRQQVMVPTSMHPARRYELGAVDWHSGETVLLTRYH